MNAQTGDRSGRGRSGLKILEITYRLEGSAAEYVEANRPYAEPIARTPGLRWKVWLLNETTREAGGIYLFESEAAMRSFLSGPIASEVRSDPTASFREFDVPEELSTVTRAPIR